MIVTRCGWCGLPVSANAPHRKKDCMETLLNLSITNKKVTIDETEYKRFLALEEAARHLVNELPESEIDLAREVWGNTNANCVLNHKNELAALVGGEK